MPKLSVTQLASYAAAVLALVVASLAEKENIRTEVEEAVQKALDGRDAKLASPSVEKKA